MNRIPTSLLIFAVAFTMAAQSNDVNFNVIVKDKKGVTIKGLNAAQFEITDGGNKMKAAKVRLIDGAQGIDESGAAKPVEPAQRLKLFVLAFEAMGNAERRLAKDIALNLLKEDKAPNHLFAVFIFANQLSILQPFTQDHDLVAKAIDVATSGTANMKFAEIHDELKKKLRADAAAASSSLSDTDVAPGALTAAAQAMLARTQLKMLEFDGKIADGEQSRRAIAFLNSLASGLTGFPGRKAAAYITWGLVVPTHLDAAFQALQARANRAGVSFYGIDARGISESRQNAGVNDAVSRAGGQTTDSGTQNGTAVNFSGFDNTQDALRGNIQANLRVLAESTGGLLIGDTNDPKPALRQMIDDTNTYYEVTYDPAIANLDGAYRKTSIKVNSKDARVRDRDGYLALAADELDVLPYEVAMLKALTANPFPKDVAFRSGTVRLHQSKDEVSGSVLVEVPLGGLQFTEDKTAGAYSGHLAMLVQIKDPEGKIVRKYSRDLPVKGKLDQLPALKTSNFNFREQFTAPPGRYVVETVIADLASGKTGVKRAAFLAIGKSSGVAVSGVTVVRNFQPNQTNLTAEEPFQFQNGRITPTLLTTLKAVKGAQMALFFTVYPDRAAGGAPEAVIQYLKDGAELAKAALPLPAADATGKIPYVFSSPIDTMPPGLYEIKVQVKHGASVAEESVLITIEG